MALHFQGVVDFKSTTGVSKKSNVWVFRLVILC